MIAEPRTSFTARPIAPNSPREHQDPYAGEFQALASHPHNNGRRWVRLAPEKRLHRKSRTLSPRAEFLRQHENLAGALDLGPAAVPFGDQRLQRFSIRGAFERGLIGEFICRLVDRGIADAPESPGLLHPKRLCSWRYHASNAARLAGSETVARTTKKVAGIGVLQVDFHPVVPGRPQRVGALRRPMTGSGLNPESGDCLLEISGVGLARAPE